MITLELILFKQYAEQTDSIDPGETPNLRDLIWFQTDKTSHVRTLELSLFKQYAETSYCTDRCGPPHLIGLTWFHNDQTSHVRNWK